MAALSVFESLIKAEGSGCLHVEENAPLNTEDLRSYGDLAFRHFTVIPLLQLVSQSNLSEVEVSSGSLHCSGEMEFTMKLSCKDINTM
jgi:hypothetical protein